MNRREFVAAVAGTGTAALVSGCSRLSGSSARDVTLTQIVVANLHREDHVINLQLSYDGDTVLDEAYPFPAQTGDVTPDKIIEDQLPDDPGEFVVTAWTDEGASKRTEVNVGAATDFDEVWASVVTLNGVDTLVAVREGTATDTGSV